jgi:hypothetical protein
VRGSRTASSAARNTFSSSAVAPRLRASRKALSVALGSIIRFNVARLFFGFMRAGRACVRPREVTGFRYLGGQTAARGCWLFPVLFMQTDQRRRENRSLWRASKAQYFARLCSNCLEAASAVAFASLDLLALNLAASCPLLRGNGHSLNAFPFNSRIVRRRFSRGYSL